MALVVLLRGVNVGGHRTFRPRALAEQLKHLDVVNIGAAGTFVVRRPVARSALRAEFARRLPFATEIAICDGREIAALMSSAAFASEPAAPDIVRFVTVLSKLPRSAPPLPALFPERGRWLVKIVSREGRYVFGQYRRHMDTIRHLGRADGIFGVPSTTRNWNTITAVSAVLGAGPKP